MGSIRSWFPMAVKYKQFAVGIKLKMSEIECIQYQYSNPSDCLLHVLAKRLNKNPPLTWVDVVKTLRSHSVSETRLADSIAHFQGIFSQGEGEFSLGACDSASLRKTFTTHSTVVGMGSLGSALFAEQTESLEGSGDFMSHEKDNTVSHGSENAVRTRSWIEKQTMPT